MKTDTLKQYVSLREGLEREKAELERRLRAINEALGTDQEAAPAPAREPQRQAAPQRGPRRMSAAARARIAAAQRERWAKTRGEQGAANKTAKAAGPKGGKRRMSAEQRAKIAEAQRKRWAAYRAQKGGG